MRPTIFIETTIPSYYVSRPSRNLLQFARQELTRDCWDGQRYQFDLFTSQLVLDEASEGEAAKAGERLLLLDGIPLLELTDQVQSLAEQLISRGLLPILAGSDALHLAAAGVHGMDFPPDLELQAHRQPFSC